MTTAVIIIVAVTVMGVCASIFRTRRGIDRRARGGLGDDERTTRDYQQIARGIDRGKSAGQGGWPV